MSTNVLELVGRMQSHLETITPGKDEAFTEACQANDGIWQGDVAIMIVDDIPEGYVKVDNPTEADKKLAIGETKGSRHCLSTLDGVELYVPQGWGDDEDLLIGPAFRLHQANVIEHPEHGNVHCPAGFAYTTFYARDLDEETQRERRARD